MLGVEAQSTRLKLAVLVTHCYVIDCPQNMPSPKNTHLSCGGSTRTAHLGPLRPGHSRGCEEGAAPPSKGEGVAGGGWGVSLGTARGSGRGGTGTKEASGPAKTTKAGRRRCCGPSSPRFTWSQESGESLDEKHLGTLVDRCILSCTCQSKSWLTPPP